jgi:integrase
LVDRWGSRNIAEITADDLHGAIIEAVKVAIPGIVPRNEDHSDVRGRKLAKVLSRMFRWAHQHRLISTNIAIGLYRPPGGKPRQRTLDDAEIVKVWTACGDLGFPFRDIIRLLILTGQRRGEVAGMRWSELSEGVWSLPPQRTKNARPHTIYLAAPARAIIEAVPRIEGRNMLFTRTGSSPPSGWSKMRRRLDAALPAMPAFTLHDIRRSVASGMMRLGIRTEAIERALNHQSGSFRGIVGVYQTDLLAGETQAAWELWSAHIMALVTGRAGAVVPMRRGTK